MKAIDPKDPNKYVGFDIDLGEEIARMPRLQSSPTRRSPSQPADDARQWPADIVISDIYATEERAKAADFITYSKVFDGVLVAKGNPKKITGINTTMCGAAAAENTRLCRSAAGAGADPPVKAEGKPEPTLQLYDKQRETAIQAILAAAPTPMSTTSIP